MTDETVRVPFGDSAADTATLLLAAAEESKDHSASDVMVSSYGGFVVPESLAKSAGVDYEDEGKAMGHVYSDEEIATAEGNDLSRSGFEDEIKAGDGDFTNAPQDEPDRSEEKPAKKAAAKKTAKKAPAKKAAAKKSTAKKSTEGN